ncbi:GFA family protein [Phenylobacterium sp.]|uniref:GFA family protein n=1 Tax=Phenylobacterium sp. TaxID=1871053 RepID=UPI002736D567|nr:GFA family protein [Phenylobacterium sp.]MDP3852531.1 GFA family protein [Phenylobacterium sp.]
MTQTWDGCLCGEVRFRASGAPKWTIWCHCQSCRKHSGAPASAFAAFDEAVVEMIGGEITKFRSSPGVLRGFCSTCGSTLTCEGDRSPGELHLHIGAFDQPERLAPMVEVNPEERLPWVHLGNVGKEG